MQVRLLAPVLVLAACRAPVEAPAAPAPELVRLAWQPLDDAEAARLAPLVRAAVARVEAFFGAPFPHPLTLTIHPDRAAFDASFPAEWGLGRTECWMVASGVADEVRLLSPRVWKTEACEHDPADERHVERLLAHELVHVYHGQHNPSPDFVDVTGIDWFAEGLATFASGQLADPELAPAREAIATGAAPATLARAWTGKYRYGVSGSLVAFVDGEIGRARLRGCLEATCPEELLPLVGLTEEELLAGWRAAVLAE